MRAATPQSVVGWPKPALTAWQRSPTPSRADDELWMEKEDVASAWAVSALAAAAVALLLVLAAMG